MHWFSLLVFHPLGCLGGVCCSILTLHFGLQLQILSPLPQENVHIWSFSFVDKMQQSFPFELSHLNIMGPYCKCQIVNNGFL